MPDNIVIEELGTEERKLLLKAFDYNVDSEGYILDPVGNKIQSSENPSRFLRVEDGALVPGSLKVIDSDPTSISRFLREKMEKDNDATRAH